MKFINHGVGAGDICLKEDENKPPILVFENKKPDPKESDIVAQNLCDILNRLNDGNVLQTFVDLHKG